MLGSPVVPFLLLLGSGFPCKVTNPQKGALIVIWLLGYQVYYNITIMGVFNIRGWGGLILGGGEYPKP